jgi:2-polyprenyl-3-methyl-5-hydroxy-6-metoxy-1,4-benzoquinol methylase
MISEEYKTILQELNGKDNFGKRKSLPKYLEKIISDNAPASILDFGCGLGNLIQTLREQYPNKEIQGYDPGNENFSNQFVNKKFDLVVSTDVLEHIEPDFLDATLQFLKNKSDRFYHLIALAPSSVTLPDGRNAHLILETCDWWKNKFVNLGYTVSFDHHMNHINDRGRLVNKYFISGFI